MAIKIVMVCLGNICRSPLAEGILASKLPKKKLLLTPLEQVLGISDIPLMNVLFSLPKKTNSIFLIKKEDNLPLPILMNLIIFM